MSLLEGTSASDPAVSGANRTVAAKGLIESGDYAGAEQVLAGVLADDESDAEARYLLGLGRYRAGRFSEAAAAFRKLVERAPNDYRALYSLGIALEKQGDLVGAFEVVGRSLTAKPDFQLARQKLASLRTRLEGGTPPAPAAGAATLAAMLEDDPAAVPRGELVGWGRRRVSSMAGAFLFGGIVAVGGWLAAVTLPPGLGAVLARWSLLGRTPEFYRNELQRLRDFGFADIGVERQVTVAVERLGERTAFFNEAIVSLSSWAVAAGAVIVVWALATAALTRYEVYSHRIDITKGILRRQSDAVWLYEITDVVYQQPLWLLLTRNARVVLTTDAGGRHQLVGFGGAAQMRRLWAEMRDAVVMERRAMRRWWV